MMRFRTVRCADLVPPCPITHLEGHQVPVTWRDLHPDGWGIKQLPADEHPPHPETASSHTDKDLDLERLAAELGAGEGLVLRETAEHDGPDARLVRTVHDPTGNLTTDRLDAAIAAHPAAAG